MTSLHQPFAWDPDLSSAQIAEITAILQNPLADTYRLAHYGKDAIYRVNIAGMDLAIKQYRRFSRWKSFAYRLTSTPAERAFQAAAYLSRHGVGTAHPVGYYETTENKMINRCFLATRFVADHADFPTLFSRYAHSPLLQEKLVRAVGEAIQKMHRCFFVHRDLGNQNIFLPEDPEKWTPEHVLFFDLNRGRVRRVLFFWRCAKDFSRIALPEHFQKILIAAYAPRLPLQFFRMCVQGYRKLFLFHQWTHQWRHLHRKRDSTG